MKLSLLLLASNAGLGLAAGYPYSKSCKVDTCASEVLGKGVTAPLSVRRDDCWSFMGSTVTPSPKVITKTKTITAKTTKTSTVRTVYATTTKVVKTVTQATTTTVTTTAPPEAETDQKRSELVDGEDEDEDDQLVKRAASKRTKPSYAKACKDSKQYSSACSCWAITTYTKTAARPTTTIWSTFTSVPVKKVTRTITTTAKATTTTLSTAVRTTTVPAPVPPFTCPNTYFNLEEESGCGCCWSNEQVPKRAKVWVMGEPEVNNAEECAKLCDAEGGKCRAWEHYYGICLDTSPRPPHHHCTLFTKSDIPADPEQADKTSDFGKMASKTCTSSVCNQDRVDSICPAADIDLTLSGGSGCGCCWQYRTVPIRALSAVQKTITTIKSPGECARACDTDDNGCQSWQYYVQENNNHVTTCQLFNTREVAANSQKTYDVAFGVKRSDTCTKASCNPQPEPEVVALPECSSGTRGTDESSCGCCYTMAFGYARPPEVTPLASSNNKPNNQDCQTACDLNAECNSFLYTNDGEANTCELFNAAYPPQSFTGQGDWTVGRKTSEECSKASCALSSSAPAAPDPRTCSANNHRFRSNRDGGCNCCWGAEDIYKNYDVSHTTVSASSNDGCATACGDSEDNAGVCHAWYWDENTSDCTLYPETPYGSMFDENAGDGAIYTKVAGSCQWSYCEDGQ